VRNIRKAMGKRACFSVCGLNRMSVSPAVNMGSVNMWYSMGVKV